MGGRGGTVDALALDANGAGLRTHSPRAGANPVARTTFLFSTQVQYSKRLVLVTGWRLL